MDMGVRQDGGETRNAVREKVHKLLFLLTVVLYGHEWYFAASTRDRDRTVSTLVAILGVGD